MLRSRRTSLILQLECHCLQVSMGNWVLILKEEIVKVRGVAATSPSCPYLFASSKVNSLLPLLVGCVGGRIILSTAALANAARHVQMSHRIVRLILYNKTRSGSVRKTIREKSRRFAAIMKSQPRGNEATITANGSFRIVLSGWTNDLVTIYVRVSKVTLV